MSNPLYGLKDALNPIFHLQSMRNGKYIYPEIQHLKDALNAFHPGKPHSVQNFTKLLSALKASLPYIETPIEKGIINFTAIKNSIDVFNKQFGLTPINWNVFFVPAQKSPKFFNPGKALKEIELLPWLAEKSGVKVTAENLISLLLEHREHFGFSQKLGGQLEKDPNFLFRLIMASEKNFTQIAGTRLVLHLTDQQLAEAIIKHSPCFVHNHTDPLMQATQLVEKLNEILSNGRSVSTLLRNAEAKFILDTSELILLYQHEKTNEATGTNFPSPAEEGSFKPSM